ncbi:MAG: Lecithin:cholesterol acyltransferase-domain-containing protein [Benniella sp.]|nr:MAG: Lecithin:cholesterol acyltransferase-domain-containing protein [Benniella sp.]
MGVRNRKPLHERAATDSVASYNETGAEVESTENHGNLTKEDEEAILKLTDALPKKAKLKGRHPSLSRNPSVANYLHKVLFVSEEEAHGRKHFAPGARRRAILLLGIIIGMGLAMLLMGQTKDVAYMEALSHYFHEFDLASMVPTGMIPEEFIGNMSALFRPDILTEEAFHPGEELRQVYGYKPKYPVTMIPGIVSTGLESWSTTHNCSQKYFRKRMWGTTTMFKAVLLDKDCWITNMRLDSATGLDPEGVRLRAAQGLEAADYLVPGYWVWAPIIKNLAAIGYDNNNMHLASYDWRLSFANLETRDHYFSRLKSSLELSLKVTGEKHVLVAHSMGSLVLFYFFKWVESEQGGNGGPNWVKDHVHTFVNIAGPMLGVPKTLAAVLSGEVRDTAQLGVVGAYVLEKFFSRRERADLFRSWGGLSSMLPKGGNRVWGTVSSAPDDGTHDEEETLVKEKIAKNEETPGAITKDELDDQESPSFGAMLAFAEDSDMKHHTMDESMELLSSLAGVDYNDMLARNYSVGASVTEEEMAKTDKLPTSWSNPLEATLPNAPDMKIYCLYGVGKSTERSYSYNRMSDLTPQILDQRPGNVSDETGKIPNIYIDTTVHDDKLGISYGIHQGDGDGTVPLLSTGYMCVDGWKKKLYNPSGSKIITREFTHQSSPSPVDIRGGKRTADHVDILGNFQVTKDLLAIVAGRDGDGLEEQIFSKIREYSAKVDV